MIVLAVPKTSVPQNEAQSFTISKSHLSTASANSSIDGMSGNE